MQQGYSLSGRYQLVEVVGSGGMATVYRGYEQALDRDVAVKVITANMNAVEDYEERFNREARIVAKLQHPSIIQIHYYGIDDIGSYVVMPLLNGGTLAERMRQASQLISVREVGDLALKVGGALHHAHKNNVIHRDIKFSNIMFDDEGNPYVMDFGIARLMSQTGLTMTGTFVGTPQFMAPEQWRGEITAAVDQYALSVVLYELLSGNPPFEAATAHEYMFQHMQVEPKPVNIHREDVPEAVSAALARAMSKEPQDRFPTIQAFVETLHEAALSTSNQTTGFFTYSLAARETKPFKLPGTGTGTGVRQASNPPQPPPQPPVAQAVPQPSSGGNRMNLIVPLLVVGIIIVFVLMYLFNQQTTQNATATLEADQTSIALAIAQDATETQSANETSEALAIEETTLAETEQAASEATESASDDEATEEEEEDSEAVAQAATEEPTDEPTDEPTATATFTVTPSETATATFTVTPSETATATHTVPPTSTRRPSDTPSPTPTSTETPTVTPTATHTPTETPLPTDTPIPTNTPNPIVKFYQEGFDDESGLVNWDYDENEWFVTTFEGETVFESASGIDYPVTIQSPQGISGWTQNSPQDLYMSMRFYLDRESVGLRLVFNYTERGYHAVEIAPGAITVKRNSDGVDITDRGSERVIGTNQGLDLQIDTWHEVKIWSTFEQIYVYLDNELILLESDQFITTSGSVMAGDVILQTISPPWSAYIDDVVVQRVDALSTHFTDPNNLPFGWSSSEARDHASIEDDGGNYYLELMDEGTVTTAIEPHATMEFYCRLLNVEGGYQIDFVDTDGSTLRFDFRFGTLDVLLVNPDGSENNLRNVPNFYGYNSWNLLFVDIVDGTVNFARDGDARTNNAFLPISIEIDTLQFRTFEDDVLQIDDCMVRGIP